MCSLFDLRRPSMKNADDGDCDWYTAKFQVDALVYTQDEEPAACINLWSTYPFLFSSLMTRSAMRASMFSPIGTAKTDDIFARYF